MLLAVYGNILLVTWEVGFLCLMLSNCVSFLNSVDWNCASLSVVILLGTLKVDKIKWMSSL